jgi:hypothetical protein
LSLKKEEASRRKAQHSGETIHLEAKIWGMESRKLDPNRASFTVFTVRFQGQELQGPEKEPCFWLQKAASRSLQWLCGLEL